MTSITKNPFNDLLISQRDIFSANIIDCITAHHRKCNRQIKSSTNFVYVENISTAIKASLINSKEK